MSKTTVTGAFRNAEDADVVYGHILSMGYSPQCVDIMVSDQTKGRITTTHDDERGTSSGSLAEEGAGVGGAIGTAAGATLGAILAAGTSVVLPGIGLVVTGALAGALAGAGAGGVTGGLLGALVGYGIPEADVRVYEKILHEGGVVMGVHPGKDGDASDIEKVMKEHNGEQVCTVNI